MDCSSMLKIKLFTVLFGNIIWAFKFILGFYFELCLVPKFMHNLFHKAKKIYLYILSCAMFLNVRYGFTHFFPRQSIVVPSVMPRLGSPTVSLIHFCWLQSH
jgi:hypothetical protein